MVGIVVILVVIAAGIQVTFKILLLSKRQMIHFFHNCLGLGYNRGNVWPSYSGYSGYNGYSGTGGYSGHGSQTGYGGRGWSSGAGAGWW